MMAPRSSMSSGQSSIPMRSSTTEYWSGFPSGIVCVAVKSASEFMIGISRIRKESPTITKSTFVLGSPIVTPRFPAGYRMRSGRLNWLGIRYLVTPSTRGTITSVSRYEPVSFVESSSRTKFAFLIQYSSEYRRTGISGRQASMISLRVRAMALTCSRPRRRRQPRRQLRSRSWSRRPWSWPRICHARWSCP